MFLIFLWHWIGSTLDSTKFYPTKRASTLDLGFLTAECQEHERESEWVSVCPGFRVVLHNFSIIWRRGCPKSVCNVLPCCTTDFHRSNKLHNPNHYTGSSQPCCTSPRCCTPSEEATCKTPPVFSVLKVTGFRIDSRCTGPEKDNLTKSIEERTQH